MDFMLDLETLGTRCGSVILSIGVCVFDRHRGFEADMPNFQIFLRPREQMIAGATIDPSTVLWWLDQSEQARKAILAGQEDAKLVQSALLALDMWFGRVCPDKKARVVWANGSDFDISLLSELYRKIGDQPPWEYNAARDMRTVFDLAGCKPKDLLPAPAGAHDALTDAIYQARVMALAICQIKEI